MNNIIGPINQGDAFTLGYFDGVDYYALSYYSQGDILFFDRNFYFYIDEAVNIYEIVKLSAQGTINNFIINIPINNSSLGISSNGIAILNATGVPSFLTVNSQKFSQWSPPALFLSGEEYFFLNKEKNIPISFNSGYSNPNGAPTIEQTVNSGIIQPYSFYINCPNSIQSQSILSSVCSGFCSFFPGSTICNSSSGQCYDENGFGFTRQSDCAVGITYNYCLATEACGDDCVGPCTKDGEICVLDPATKNGTCTSSDQWVGPVVITCIVIGFVILLIIIIVAGIVHGHNEKHHPTV